MVAAPPPIAAPTSAPFLPLTAPPTPAPTPADEPMISALFCHERPLRRSTTRGADACAIADRARRRAIHDRRLHHPRRVVVGRRDGCAADAGIANGIADRGCTGHTGHRHAVHLRDRLAGEQARADQRLLARAAVDGDRRGTRCGSGDGRGRRSGERRAGVAAGNGERADTEQGRRRESRYSRRMWGLHVCLLGHHPTQQTSTSVPTTHP